MPTPKPIRHCPSARDSDEAMATDCQSSPCPTGGWVRAFVTRPSQPFLEKTNFSTGNMIASPVSRRRGFFDDVRHHRISREKMTKDHHVSSQDKHSNFIDGSQHRMKDSPCQRQGEHDHGAQKRNKNKHAQKQGPHEDHLAGQVWCGEHGSSSRIGISSGSISHQSASIPSVTSGALPRPLPRRSS